MAIIFIIFIIITEKSQCFPPFPPFHQVFNKMFNKVGGIIRKI